MNGRNMAAVNQRLNQEALRISEQEDKLITNFVTSNFDNVLGPGVFLLVTIGYEYPQLTPWIEDIMSSMRDPMPQAGAVQQPLAPVPTEGITPNELAQPSQQAPEAQAVQ